MAFFEAAMARLGNVQLKNAKKLIHEGGDLGLRSLYEKAKMPERLFSAVRAAVQILAERSEERRVGKESVSTLRYRRSPDTETNNKSNTHSTNERDTNTKDQKIN